MLNDINSVACLLSVLVQFKACKLGKIPLLKKKHISLPENKKYISEPEDSEDFKPSLGQLKWEPSHYEQMPWTISLVSQRSQKNVDLPICPEWQRKHVLSQLQHIVWLMSCQHWIDSINVALLQGVFIPILSEATFHHKSRQLSSQSWAQAVFILILSVNSHPDPSPDCRQRVLPIISEAVFIAIWSAGKLHPDCKLAYPALDQGYNCDIG